MMSTRVKKKKKEEVETALEATKYDGEWVILSCEKNKTKKKHLALLTHFQLDPSIKFHCFFSTKMVIESLTEIGPLFFFSIYLSNFVVNVIYGAKKFRQPL